MAAKSMKTFTSKRIESTLLDISIQDISIICIEL